MTKRIEIQITRSTKKAHLVVSADGRQAWVQRRWVSDDNTVSEKTFTRQSEEFEARNGSTSFDIARETEKAVAAECPINFAGFDDTMLVWFPKSVVEISDGKASAPNWLVNRKLDEAVERFQPRGGNYENHRYCKGERPIVTGSLVAN